MSNLRDSALALRFSALGVPSEKAGEVPRLWESCVWNNWLSLLEDCDSWTRIFVIRRPSTQERIKSIDQNGSKSSLRPLSVLATLIATESDGLIFTAPEDRFLAHAITPALVNGLFAHSGRQG